MPTPTTTSSSKTVSFPLTPTTSICRPATSFELLTLTRFEHHAQDCLICHRSSSISPSALPRLCREGAALANHVAGLICTRGDGGRVCCAHVGIGERPRREMEGGKEKEREMGREKREERSVRVELPLRSFVQVLRLLRATEREDIRRWERVRGREGQQVRDTAPPGSLDATYSVQSRVKSITTSKKSVVHNLDSAKMLRPSAAPDSVPIIQLREPTRQHREAEKSPLVLVEVRNVTRQASRSEDTSCGIMKRSGKPIAQFSKLVKSGHDKGNAATRPKGGCVRWVCRCGRCHIQMLRLK